MLFRYGRVMRDSLIEILLIEADVLAANHEVNSSSGHFFITMLRVPKFVWLRLVQYSVVPLGPIITQVARRYGSLRLQTFKLDVNGEDGVIGFEKLLQTFFVLVNRNERHADRFIIFAAPFHL
jgi:hypothetical protein